MVQSRALSKTYTEGSFWACGYLYSSFFITGVGLWHGYRKDFSSNFLFHLKLLLFALMVLNFAYIYFFQYRKGKFSAIPSLIAINFIFAILIYLIISWIA
jgi:uncharacterized phage infection (PIP) family protein YhgE